jgi:hypothetical protein
MKIVTVFLSLFPFVLTPALATAPSNKIPLSNFKIVSFQPEWRHETFYAIGEIKNIGKIPAGVQVQVIARDSQGTLVDCQQFWPNSINNIYPGMSCGIIYPITSNTRAKTFEIQIIRVKVWD